MSIAPNRWTARGIWAIGGAVFATAVITLGIELLDVVGAVAIALFLVGAVALRRWSQ